MRFVSFFIPATVQAKAGLRTKRRMPFILGTNLLGFIVALSCAMYTLISGNTFYFKLLFLSTAALFILSIISQRQGKFAAGAYFCTVSLFLLCSLISFLLPALNML